MLGMILPRERLYFLLLQYTLRSLESVSMKSGQSGCHMQSAADENRHDSLPGGGGGGFRETTNFWSQLQKSVRLEKLQ